MLVPRHEDKLSSYNYSRRRLCYVSTAEVEEEIDLVDVHKQLMEIEKRIAEAAKKHNQFLKELGLPPI